jgi:branched-chain amino acid transport system substrate-binding protein
VWDKARHNLVMGVPATTARDARSFSKAHTRGAWRRTASRVVAATLAAAGAGFVAFTTLVGQGCAKEAPKPSAPEPIVIGVSLGLSKDLASFTVPLRDAVRSAEGEINAGGGLLGRPVRFEVVDDKSDEGDGVKQVARDFAAKKVVAVIGPISSGQVKATQKIYADQQILQITPAATSVELTDSQPIGNRFLFRTTPADDFQGAAVVLFAARTPRGLSDAGAPDTDGGAPATCTRLSIVYIDNPYGTSMTKVIADNFPKRGGTITSQNKISLDTESSYADLVEKIIGADLSVSPECLAIISYEKAAAQFIKDFKASSRWPALERKGFFFIGTDGVFTQGFLEASRTNPSDDTSPSSAEDAVYGTNPDTTPRTTEYNAFRTIFTSYFPLPAADEGPAFAANTFDAAVLIAFAIQKAGTIDDRTGLRDALRDVSRPGGRPISPSEIREGLLELRGGGDIDYKGASGNVNFEDNGNVTSGFIIWQSVRDKQSNKVVYKTIARFGSEELMEQIR